MGTARCAGTPRHRRGASYSVRSAANAPGDGGFGRSVDDIDLGQAFSSGWEYRETIEIRGYLTGVPLDDPSGHGVEIAFAAPDWDIVDGHAESLPVRF
ncbi:hypothetical protein HDA32_004640 [Spinactinospora alkalitolerans]|uniref:Uncharacterized protein n=1 Tax=Spinactinospora alkalitolerans TaxID=687207 RepID=A0A852U6I0_9ACTN|nr:hypothetical protein [Spinactinospora alkalitolerans]NYE49520.1 hypothetical protein [Spinactinospora alkalitolerans]